MVPLSFIILTLTICGARPLLQRCIGSSSSSSLTTPQQLKSEQRTQQQQQSEQRPPSASSPLLGHPQDPHRYEGYSSSTHYNAIDPRVNNDRCTTRTHLGSTLQQESITAKKQAAESSMSWSHVFFFFVCELLYHYHHGKAYPGRIALAQTLGAELNNAAIRSP